MSHSSSMTVPLEKCLWLPDKMGFWCSNLARSSKSDDGRFSHVGSRIIWKSPNWKETQSEFLLPHSDIRIRQVKETREAEKYRWTFHNLQTYHNIQKIIDQLSSPSIALLPHPACSPELSPCECWLFNFWMGRSNRWSRHVVEEMTIISRDISLEHFNQSSKNGCGG
jgi:hypothetical protein